MRVRAGEWAIQALDGAAELLRTSIAFLDGV
jgi:hypothetical protein